MDWKYRKEDSKWLGGCTSVQEHCTVLAGLRDKEAARGRPADWSETSAGGERLERDIPKKQKGGLFAFWQNQTSGNCAPSLGTNLKLNVNKYFPYLQVHGLWKCKEMI